MKLSQFNFTLPPNLLADRPSEYRDECRLMVLNRKDQTIEHKLFKDVVDYFQDSDVVVLNNTKVFPARLYAIKEKTGAEIEVFLLRELVSEVNLWDTLVDPARKIRIGNKLYFDDNNELVAEVVDNTTSRGRIIRFLYDGSYDEFRERLNEIGNTPLPKYIKRMPDKMDRERYQTVYAKKVGSVAAPTAGMHFSKHLLKRLEIKGVNLVELTLHVGLGTFSPVRVEDLSKHKMDSEQVSIGQNVADRVNVALDTEKRVCAVGTTSVRAMESSISNLGRLKPFEGWTHKYIYPPYNFSVVNTMITNFHIPKSTLLMMTAAFAGHEFLMHAYNEAIKEKYHFYSYGDAMLIL